MNTSCSLFSIILFQLLPFPHSEPGFYCISLLKFKRCLFSNSYTLWRQADKLSTRPKLKRSTNKKLFTFTFPGHLYQSPTVRNILRKYNVGLHIKCIYKYIMHNKIVSIRCWSTEKGWKILLSPVFYPLSKNCEKNLNKKKSIHSSHERCEIRCSFFLS